MIHYILKPEEIRSIVKDHLHRFGVDQEVADRIGWIVSRGYDPEGLVFWLQEIGYNELHARILALMTTERLVAEARRRAQLHQAYASVVMMPVLPPADSVKRPRVSEPSQSISRTSEINPSTSRQEDLASRVLKEIKRLKRKVLLYEREAVDREARRAYEELLSMLREEHEALMTLFRSRIQSPGPCEGYKDPYYRFLCITARGVVDFIREKRLRSAIRDLAKVIQTLSGEELYG